MTLPLAALLQGAAATPPVGEGAAKAIDLDGTNDYLSRASDFTGNADGKTFTFSAWVWVDGAGVTHHLLCSDTGSSDYRFQVNLSGNLFGIVAKNSANAFILSVDVPSPAAIQSYTLYNLLVSADLSNSSNRQAYVNDVSTTASWGIYTNDNIDFTTSAWKIAARYDAAQKLKGRLAHIFLDYTYRDLLIEANRRLFITADRKPAAKAGLVALNPILYLPMDDPTTAHINQGTGGNFTLNGVVARSGRGPNQYNAAYSDLDGSADYVSKTGALLGSGSKTITFSCSFNPDSVTTDQYLFGFWTSVTTIAQIFGVYIGADGSFGVLGQVSPGTGTYILNAGSAAGVLKAGRNYTLQISIDLSDTGKRFVYLNGEAVSMTWTTYTDDYIYLNQASNSPITSAGRSRTFYFNGRLGNVFFHTSYIDLSNAANLAKFVTGTGIDAKPVDMGANGELPLGVTPLIYLPMYGNNAGKNYGSGGDFTVNSGPYTGARGPNEFWGNKADFDGSTGYLARTSALTGVSDGKTFSIIFHANKDVNKDANIVSNSTSANIYRFEITHNASNQASMRCVARDTAGNNVLSFTTNNGVFTTGTTAHVMIAIDLTDTAKRKVYVNGLAIADGDITWTTYSNTNIDWVTTPTKWGVGCAIQNTTSWLFDGKLSEFYFTTEYIDFSQEANRLKFRDAFGSPVALLPQIEAGAIPAPAIYLRFDPADQGRNDGTGGNFTKSGTITDGGQL
jgi:hypothetical protein